MLSRFLSKPSNLRLLTLISSQTHKIIPHTPFPNPNFTSTFQSSQSFSTSNNNNGDKSTPNIWKISPETEESGVFDPENDAGARGISGGDEFNSPAEIEPWTNVSMDSGGDGSDVFGGIEETGFGGGGGGEEWDTAEGYQPWSFAEEDKGGEVFDAGGVENEDLEGLEGGDVNLEELAKEEEALKGVLKGPNRAFGDLIAASGITDDMLDSLIALKDLDSVDGLPPLSKIEDLRYEKNTKKSSRADIERQKQEEVAKARVRQVDEKGRAYGTGRRKCSVARVWIQPGDGQFLVNDKQFDVYFPVLDNRAALLRPFSETKTLGLWDVTCTVKGGGVSGQVGAIQLGISRALQNWEPGLRPPLREVGFLTRDPRVVERKKPGKAKARKSFQWVKR